MVANVNILFRLNILLHLNMVVTLSKVVTPEMGLQDVVNLHSRSEE